MRAGESIVGIACLLCRDADELVGYDVVELRSIAGSRWFACGVFLVRGVLRVSGSARSFL